MKIGQQFLFYFANDIYFERTNYIRKERNKTKNKKGRKERKERKTRKRRKINQIRCSTNVVVSVFFN